MRHVRLKFHELLSQLFCGGKNKGFHKSSLTPSDSFHGNSTEVACFCLPCQLSFLDNKVLLNWGNDLGSICAFGKKCLSFSVCSEVLKKILCFYFLQRNDFVQQSAPMEAHSHAGYVEEWNHYFPFHFKANLC